MKKILLCDDTQSVLELLDTWLCDANYQVITVSLLPIAIRLYDGFPFDLVISDDMGGGGVEWLDSLYADGQKVLNTSATTMGDHTMPLLTKPITKEQLLAKVRELIGETVPRQSRRHEKSPDPDGCGNA